MTNNFLNLDTANYLNIAGSLINNIGQGISGYYGAKSQALSKQTSLYNQSIPLYQEISARVQQLQQQQAVAYLNSGIDVSKGTASHVINHTTEQGKIKMQEITDNIAIEVINTKKIGQAEAVNSLFSSIAQGVANSMQQLTNFELYKQQRIYKNNNKSNLFKLGTL